MKVSVIIPCHNAVPTLVRCLENVRQALPAESEIIAVDDGSDDGTGVVLKAYGEAYACLKVVSLAAPAHGVSAARNAALKVAQGEYIQFVDADDTVEPNFCRAMLEAMERDAADYCICGYWQVPKKEGAERTQVHLKGSYHYTSSDEIRREYLPRILGYSLKDLGGWLLGRDMYAKKRESGEVWRGCYRRAIIAKWNLQFSESVVLNEDALFTADYLLASHSMTSVDEPLYNYTVGNAASSVEGIRRDARQYCANKLELLRERQRLNRLAEGRLAAQYRGSNWLSLAEIALRTLKGDFPRKEGLSILKTYMKEMSK